MYDSKLFPSECKKIEILDFLDYKMDNDRQTERLSIQMCSAFTETAGKLGTPPASTSAGVIQLNGLLPRKRKCSRTLRIKLN